MPLPTKNGSIITHSEVTLFAKDAYSKTSSLNVDLEKKYGWTFLSASTDEYEKSFAYLNQISDSKKNIIASRTQGYYAKHGIHHEKKIIAVASAGTQTAGHEDFLYNLTSDSQIFLGMLPSAIETSKKNLEKLREFRDKNYPDYEIIHIGHSLGGFHAAYHGVKNNELGINVDSPGVGEFLSDNERRSAKSCIYTFISGDDNAVNTLNTKVGRIYRYVLDDAGIEASHRGGFISTHGIEAIAMKAIDPTTQDFRELIPIGNDKPGNLWPFLRAKLKYVNDTLTYYGDGSSSEFPELTWRDKPDASQYTYQAKSGDRYKTAEGRNEVAAKKAIFHRYQAQRDSTDHTRPDDTNTINQTATHTTSLKPVQTTQPAPVQAPSQYKGSIYPLPNLSPSTNVFYSNSNMLLTHEQNESQEPGFSVESDGIHRHWHTDNYNFGVSIDWFSFFNVLRYLIKGNNRTDKEQALHGIDKTFKKYLSKNKSKHKENLLNELNKHEKLFADDPNISLQLKALKWGVQEDNIHAKNWVNKKQGMGLNKEQLTQSFTNAYSSWLREWDEAVRSLDYTKLEAVENKYHNIPPELKIKNTMYADLLQNPASFKANTLKQMYTQALSEGHGEYFARIIDALGKKNAHFSAIADSVLDGKTFDPKHQMWVDKARQSNNNKLSDQDDETLSKLKEMENQIAESNLSSQTNDRQESEETFLINATSFEETKRQNRNKFLEWSAFKSLFYVAELGGFDDLTRKNIHRASGLASNALTIYRNKHSAMNFVNMAAIIGDGLQDYEILPQHPFIQQGQKFVSNLSWYNSLLEISFDAKNSSSTSTSLRLVSLLGPELIKGIAENLPDHKDTILATDYAAYQLASWGNFITNNRHLLCALPDDIYYVYQHSETAYEIVSNTNTFIINVADKLPQAPAVITSMGNAAVDAGNAIVSYVPDQVAQGASALSNTIATASGTQIAVAGASVVIVYYGYKVAYRNSEPGYGSFRASRNIHNAIVYLRAENIKDAEKSLLKVFTKSLGDAYYANAFSIALSNKLFTPELYAQARGQSQADLYSKIYMMEYSYHHKNYDDFFAHAHELDTLINALACSDKSNEENEASFQCAKIRVKTLSENYFIDLINQNNFNRAAYQHAQQATAKNKGDFAKLYLMEYANHHEDQAAFLTHFNDFDLEKSFDNGRGKTIIETGDGNKLAKRTLSLTENMFIYAVENKNFSPEMLRYALDLSVHGNVFIDLFILNYHKHHKDLPAFFAYARNKLHPCARPQTEREIKYSANTTVMIACLIDASFFTAISDKNFSQEIYEAAIQQTQVPESIGSACYVSAYHDQQQSFFAAFVAAQDTICRVQINVGLAEIIPQGSNSHENIQQGYALAQYYMDKAMNTYSTQLLATRPAWLRLFFGSRLLFNIHPFYRASNPNLNVNLPRAMNNGLFFRNYHASSVKTTPENGNQTVYAKKYKN